MLRRVSHKLFLGGEVRQPSLFTLMALYLDWNATNEGWAWLGMWLSTDDMPPAVSFIKFNDITNLYT